MRRFGLCGQSDHFRCFGDGNGNEELSSTSVAAKASAGVFKRRSVGLAAQHDVSGLFGGVEHDLGFAGGELALDVADFVVQAGLGEPVVGAFASDELFNQSPQRLGCQIRGVDIDEAFFVIHGDEG